VKDDDGKQEPVPVTSEFGEQEPAAVTGESGEQTPSPRVRQKGYKAHVPKADERGRLEHLWRWLGISVGGTLAPFGILALSYYVNKGHLFTWEAALGNGDLFIPASIMNVEAIWIWARFNGWKRRFGFPCVAISCGLAALAGACTFGIATAAQEAAAQQASGHQSSAHQLATAVTVTPTDHRVTIISLIVFLVAFVVGTSGVIMLMLSRGQEGVKR
jgi:hypothetical protein